MKFIRHHLEAISGIEIYPLVSLCIFFTFFVLLFVYVVKLSKRYVHEMETMPLENDAESIELNKST